MTTGKTIALTRRTFVGKVMSLLLNMLSRLVITSLPRSKHLLISWLQSPSVVILEPRKIKSDTVSTVSPSISHEMMGTLKTAQPKSGELSFIWGKIRTDVTLPIKVHLVKAMVFPVVMYGYESWTVKKAEP